VCYSQSPDRSVGLSLETERFGSVSRPECWSDDLHLETEILVSAGPEAEVLVSVSVVVSRFRSGTSSRSREFGLGPARFDCVIAR